VKKALSSWWLSVFSPLRIRLKLALQEYAAPIDITFMDLCSEYELSAEITDCLMGDIVSNASEAGQSEIDLSLFVPYEGEYGTLFRFGAILKDFFPHENPESDDDDDEYLYEDILNLKFPNVNISVTKEEGSEGFANTSLLPSELVFEIFTFLDTEKELIIAGQVCRRWYVLTKHKRLWQALKERKAVSKDLVRLYSKEGHEFTVGLNEATRSGTLASVLKMHTAVEAKTHTVRFSTLRTNVLEKIVQYFYYKVMYMNSTAPIPEFPIEPEIALEILMASHFLDC